MSRSSSVVRSSRRSEGSYHREMRRRKLAHPLVPHDKPGAMVSIFSGVLRLFTRRRRRRF